LTQKNARKSLKKQRKAKTLPIGIVLNVLMEGTEDMHIQKYKTHTKWLKKIVQPQWKLNRKLIQEFKTKLLVNYPFFKSFLLYLSAIVSFDFFKFFLDVSEI